MQATPTTRRCMTSINVLTVNMHMGFSLLNRRFVLPELREAIRGVSADMVFLQEDHVGRHEIGRAHV